jgi:cutinase
MRYTPSILLLAAAGNALPFSLPFRLPSLPTATSGVKPASSGAVATSTTSGVVAQPTPTGHAGEGSIGSNCTPQGGTSGIGGFGGMTENGVKDKNCCTDVTIIFARGTSEPGNMGVISGPPMVKALREKLGADKVTVQGVDYPADIAVSSALLPLSTARQADFYTGHKK